MTNSIADLDQADVILVVGSNTTEAHPIVGIELTRAALRGARVIVVDPRRIRLVDHAERWLRIQPGTNVALVNAMMRIILDESLADEDFIEERTEGFWELRHMLSDYDLESAAELTGISLADIREAAIAYGSAENAAIVYCMGVTQHASGTDQVRSMANLAMLTGNIGRPGTGVNPLRGQNSPVCPTACRDTRASPTGRPSTASATSGGRTSL
jgi:anaerobic selenocysteine-containing dehydrogenase